MSDTNNKQLKPYLSRLGAWSLAIGTSLGWGSVVVTSNTYLAQAGPVGSILGLSIGAVVMLIISRCFHYMMNRVPSPGGVYAYAKESFGYDHGFLTAWFALLTYIAMFWANVTALPLFADFFLGDMFKFGFHYSVFGYEMYFGEALLSIGVIVLAAFLCTLNKKVIARVMIALALLFSVGIAVCFVKAMFGGVSADPTFIPGRSKALQVLRIAVISPWAFIGFESISHSAKEFRFPMKKTFRVLTAAVIVAAGLYIALLMLSVSAYPPEYANWLEYIASLDHLDGIKALPVFYSVEHYMGHTGLMIMMLGLLAMVLTSLIANIVALSRLLFAMSEDGVIPRRLAKLNRHNVPSRPIWIVMAVSLFIPFLGRAAIGWIVDVTTINAIILYGFVCVCARKLAKRNNDRLDHRMGIAGFVIMVIFGVYMVLNNLLSSASMEAESFLLFTAWTVVGFVVFFFLLRRDRDHKFGRSTIVWVFLLMLVLFTSLTWMNQASIKATSQSMDRVREHYSDAATDSEDESFIVQELTLLRREDVKVTTVIMMLFAVSLGIHVQMQRRHEEVQRERVRAEEDSRAKSRFLFNMSHDIRTPMNAIIGFSNLAQREGVTAEEKDEYLGKIDRAGEQLLDIINEVLDMSRIENDKMELEPVPTDLCAIADEMRDLFVSQMEEKQIDFVTDAANVTDRWVMADKHRLNRVLLNMIGNSYKFTPEGGRISFVIRQTASRGQEGDYELIVSDTGIGMSPEFVKNMFTPFERERTSTVSGIQGTGLGLSITKGIVDLMDSDIGVESEQGKGTTLTVRLTLPIIDAPENITEEPDDTPETLDFTQYRLLLAEDNMINMEIACAVLGQLGFTLETAEDGQKALDLYKAAPAGHFDAVLTDIQMPVMDGYTLAREIRALPDPAYAQIPIVAMTANVFREDIKAAEDAGMDYHVAKPIDVGELVSTLSAALTQSK